MKKIKLLSMMMLAVMALPFMVSCSDGDDDGGSGGKGNHGGDTNVTVIVNENGTTSNGSIFSAIDDKNFYLDYIKYTVKDGHLYVSGFDEAGFKGVANIVARVTYKGNTYEVLEIGDDYFNRPFWLCTSLTSVTIPNSVISMGISAFEGCSGLTSLTIGNGVTSIVDYAFKGCRGLTSITIPDNVKSIGLGAFIGCSGLTSITIPHIVTSIGEYAFYKCSGLTSISIPNNVTSIGNHAFRDCSGLTSIKVESGNTVYDSRDNCNAIIETATNKLLKGCDKTKIPNSVTSIGEAAFSGCSGLTSISISQNITSIGGFAFDHCSGLTSIKVENGNTVYDSRDNCNAIIETATNTLLKGCDKTKIPNSVTSIGGAAFSGCSGLTSISVPNNVTSIGGYAFQDCSGLTSISIPNNVTSIGNRAFYGCSGLTSLIIEDGKTVLTFSTSEWSDYYPSSGYPAENLYLGRNISYSDQDSPFRENEKLKTLTIGNSVTYISGFAFYGCTGLTSIHCLAEMPPSVYVGYGDPFSNDTYQTATLYVPTESYSAYKNADYWKKFDNIVEE